MTDALPASSATPPDRQPAARAATESADPHAWLEEVDSDRALAWVAERNAETLAMLEPDPRFAPIRDQLRAVLDAQDRIPAITRRGRWFYNLWRDAAHPRGLWRRTTLDGYRQPEPPWDVVLDLDALAAAEGENWVWSGVEAWGLGEERVLIELSRGGADAVVVREFDMRTRAFVPGGFELPEAKSFIAWADADTLYVGTDTGPGSLTDSGYPRTVRRWARGTAWADAPVVFEGEAGDVWAAASVDHTPGWERTTFSRSLDFYNHRVWLLEDGQLLPLPKPDDASLAFWREHVLLELRSDWTAGGRTHRAGSLLLAPLAAHRRGDAVYTTLFEPTSTRSLAGWSTTRSALLVNVMDDVASRLQAWHRDGEGWRPVELPAPYPGTLGVTGLHEPLLADDPLAEQVLVSSVDFLAPDRLLLGSSDGSPLQVLKSLPPRFDATGMQVEQAFATSRDGTRVPYFVIRPAGADDGRPRPTVLYGYGGFEVSLQPWYMAGSGPAWLGRGGTYVVANIRGGGEYGPAWHQAALREHRQRAYDDFAAVAEAVIARGLTTPAQLGIEGGSNGGLLVGNAMLQRPELYAAVMCQVPLLDMQRYTKLLAGASWIAEYGDPDDPADWTFLQRYSPYHRVPPAGTRLPPVLFITSTRDDRVHPGHARKMTARLREHGHAAWLYENVEGGHGAAADNEQRARMQALEFTFLWQRLGGSA